jgi:hypothetical protein
MIILVKLSLKEDTLNSRIKTLEEVDYSFNHNNILETEIIDCFSYDAVVLD